MPLASLSRHRVPLHPSGLTRVNNTSFHVHNIVGQSVFEGQVLLNPFHNNTGTMNVKLEQKILII